VKWCCSKIKNKVRYLEGSTSNSAFIADFITKRVLGTAVKTVNIVRASAFGTVGRNRK
jgi:hypothetical protein